ncbi:20902_t:CDS:2, partial [Cetraspora pellucida]
MYSTDLCLIIWPYLNQDSQEDSQAESTSSLTIFKKRSFDNGSDQSNISFSSVTKKNRAKRSF